MKKYQPYLLTGAVVLIAVVAVLFKYWAHLTNPWTRDGQVRAQVLQIAPRVTAPIVNLPIRDNQFVQAGELLFELDPRTFEQNLIAAQANLEVTRYGLDALTPQVTAAEAGVQAAQAAVTQARTAIAQAQSQLERDQSDYERQQDLLPRGATSQRAVELARATYEGAVDQVAAAQAGLRAAEAAQAQAEAALAQATASLGLPGEANARLRAAAANVDQAELELEFTRVTAPVDGYVTNLSVREGDQAGAGRPVLALVDVNSFWVHGFFRENRIADIDPGDRAIVTLMSYPDSPIEATVESLGWGISQTNGSPGANLLPTVSPTFEWIRLAQRIPVRIKLLNVPEHVALRVGTTASVIVMTDENSNATTATPVDR